MDIALFVVLVVIFIVIFKARANKRRLIFIEHYTFPEAISNKVKEKYPALNNKDIANVLEALKCYFYIANKGKMKMIAMPSQVVDVAWHEFILFTKNYESFCRKAFGRFLHHTPTEAMTKPTSAQESIKRTWRMACALESIDPKKPSRLPILFAIDSELNIEDGFKYSLNCRDRNSPTYGAGYCASHIGCSSGCSGASDSASSSCSSGCGGGCGGD